MLRRTLFPPNARDVAIFIPRTVAAAYRDPPSLASRYGPAGCLLPKSRVSTLVRLLLCAGNAPLRSAVSSLATVLVAARHSFLLPSLLRWGVVPASRTTPRAHAPKPKLCITLHPCAAHVPGNALRVKLGLWRSHFEPECGHGERGPKFVACENVGNV